MLEAMRTIKRDNDSGLIKVVMLTVEYTLNEIKINRYIKINIHR